VLTFQHKLVECWFNDFDVNVNVQFVHKNSISLFETSQNANQQQIKISKQQTISFYDFLHPFLFDKINFESKKY